MSPEDPYIGCVHRAFMSGRILHWMPHWHQKSWTRNEAIHIIYEIQRLGKLYWPGQLNDTCTYIHAIMTLSIDMLFHSRCFQEISLPPRTATPTTQTTSWLAQSLSVEVPTRLSLRGVWWVDVSTLCLVW